MTISADVIRHHVAYSNWANRLLLDAAGELNQADLQRDFGTADKSVAGTLTHIFRAERVWLARIERGETGTFSVPGDADFQFVTDQWPMVLDGWAAWAGRLTDADLNRQIEYNDLKGRPWTNALWQIALHVVNHSTHHRGQVSGFLRALGKTPPSLDFISFVRMNAMKASSA
jgi:uncharacterized damage-inducible protein DinB